MTERGICVIPKSITPERILENFNIFDFKLADEEIKELDNVKTRVRLFLFDLYVSFNLILLCEIFFDRIVFKLYLFLEYLLFTIYFYVVMKFERDYFLSRKVRLRL